MRHATQVSQFLAAHAIDGDGVSEPPIRVDRGRRPGYCGRGAMAPRSMGQPGPIGVWWVERGGGGGVGERGGYGSSWSGRSGRSRFHADYRDATWEPPPSTKPRNPRAMVPDTSMIYAAPSGRSPLELRIAAMRVQHRVNRKRRVIAKAASDGENEIERAHVAKIASFVEQHDRDEN